MIHFVNIYKFVSTNKNFNWGRKDKHNKSNKSGKYFFLATEWLASDWWVLQHSNCIEVGVPFSLSPITANIVLVRLLHRCQLIFTFKPTVHYLFVTRLEQQSSDISLNFPLFKFKYTDFKWHFDLLFWEKPHIVIF